VPCSIVDIQPPQPRQTPEIRNGFGGFVFLLLDRRLGPGCAGVASGRVVQTVDRLAVGAGDEVPVDVDGHRMEKWPICSFTYAGDSPF